MLQLEKKFACLPTGRDATNGFYSFADAVEERENR